MRLSNFYFFGTLQERPDGKQFVTDADVMQALTSGLQTLDTYFFRRDTKPGCHIGTNAEMSVVTT
jgi:hypothetical protein